MEKRKKLTKAEVERRLNEEWKAILDENNLNPSPDALKKLMRMKNPQPELLMKGGVTVTMGMLLQNFGKTVATKIDSEEELQELITALKAARNEIPSALRKAMKQITSALPRKGGPGRQPKLSPKEASQMCDQIGLCIRQKSTLKEALQKVSELTPQLLGKRVSPRTLQKAWDKRGQHGME